MKFPLSLRNVEDLLAERGIEVSYETVRYWWNRFGPMFAAEIRRKRVERMRGHGSAKTVATDGLRSCKAAMKAIGNAQKQEVGRWANDGVENRRLPLRRRERAMNRFRRVKTLQKFSSVHASVHNLFNQERQLVGRDQYRERRTAALAEWRPVTA